MDSRSNEFMVACAFGTLLHPITHAKILIQLGHEPDLPHIGDTIFSLVGLGKKRHYYPNIFVYCKHIKNEIGLYSLFTIGLPAKLLGTLVQSTVTDSAKNALYQHFDIEEDDNNPGGKYPMEIVQHTAINTAAHTVGAIVSHPIHVIMVRQIAQFVGKETEYTTIISSIKEIWNNEGISGFFSGLLPRLVGEWCLISICAIVTYHLNKYILGDRVAPDIKAYSPTLSHAMVSSLTYRFTVVSNMMAVNSSRLEVAMHFPSSLECYRYLKLQNALGRGGGLFFRSVPTGNLH